MADVFGDCKISHLVQRMCKNAYIYELMSVYNISYFRTNL